MMMMMMMTMTMMMMMMTTTMMMMMMMMMMMTMMMIMMMRMMTMMMMMMMMMMRPTNFFGRLRSNAVSLFQTNRVLHWNAPDISVLRDVHSKTLLLKRQKKPWVSRSTRKSSSTSAFKLGSFFGSFFHFCQPNVNCTEYLDLFEFSSNGESKNRKLVRSDTLSSLRNTL